MFYFGLHGLEVRVHGGIIKISSRSQFRLVYETAHKRPY
jgi:hypothetical protein